ncbi:hypothetical protein AAHC03_09233 [Spirometra sp. Aus1]
MPKRTSRREGLLRRKKKSRVKTLKTNASYKVFHSIGKRHSTNVPTYSEDGRLFYDLHTKFGIAESSVPHFAASPSSTDVKFEEIYLSDSSTVACTLSPKKLLGHRRKKERTKALLKRGRQVLPVRHRREASLNAAAKMNAMFEPVKSDRFSTATVPDSLSTSLKDPVVESVKSLPKKRKSAPCTTQRTILDDSPPPLPKRVAGLNAMAIITAVMTPTRRSSSRLRPKSDSTAASPPEKIISTQQAPETTLEKPENTFPDGRKPKKETPQKSTRARGTRKASKSSMILMAATFTASDQGTVGLFSSPNPHMSVASHTSCPLPTVESFQAQQVITCGSTCYGLENITRQIIRVPTSCLNDTKPTVEDVPSMPPVGACSTSATFPPSGALQPLSPPYASLPCVQSAWTCPPPHPNQNPLIHLPALQPQSQNAPYPSTFNHTSPFLNTLCFPHAFRQANFLMGTLIPSFQIIQTIPSYPPTFPNGQPQIQVPMNYFIPIPVSPFINAYCQNGYSCLPGYASPAHPLHARGFSPLSNIYFSLPQVEPSPVLGPKQDSFHSTLLKSVEQDFSAALPPPSEDSEFPSTPGDGLLAPVSCQEEQCSQNNVPASQPDKTVPTNASEFSSELWQWEGTAQSRYVFSKVSGFRKNLIVCKHAAFSLVFVINLCNTLYG